MEGEAIAPIFVGEGLAPAEKAGGEAAGGEPGEDPSPDAGLTADAAPEPDPPAPFEVRGTAEQIYIWSAPETAPVELLGPDHRELRLGFDQTHPKAIDFGLE